MHIGILQGGGTCPGTNAAIGGAVAAAWKEDVDVIGIPHGYRGLMTPQEFSPIQAWLNGARLSSLTYKPGCILGTSRENPLKKWEESKERITENIRRNRLDALLIIGGDDTFSVANRLREEEVIPISGIPKTIDSDLTVPSLGFHTAARRGRCFVKNMRTEAQNFGIIGIIEAMGRDAGWLARAHQEPTDPMGSADAILLPEFEVSEDTVVARMQQIFRARGHAVFVIAEGFRINGTQTYLTEYGESDPHGHGRLGGVRFRVEQWLRATGMPTYQLAPGYLYRSGRPTPEDADLASNLGGHAMHSLLRGKTGKVATMLDGRVGLMDMANVKGGRLVPKELYDAALLRRKD